MEVKRVGTFSVILLNLPTPPLHTKLNLEQNGWKWVLFWAITLLGEVFGRRKEPKAEQNIVVRSRVLRNNCLEGLFHTVSSSFVLRCLFLEWTNSRWIACVLGNVSRKHQRFTALPPSLTYKDPKRSIPKKEVPFVGSLAWHEIPCRQYIGWEKSKLPSWSVESKASRALSQWYVHTQGDRSTHGGGESSFS